MKIAAKTCFGRKLFLSLLFGQSTLQSEKVNAQTKDVYSSAWLKRCLDEAEYAGVLRHSPIIFCHSHIIRRVKLEIFLILRDVIALALVACTMQAFSAA